MLGDSAVGKSKLVERFLMDGYQPQQLSTFALTLFRYEFKHPDGRVVAVDFWDTAGQERFNNLHPSYFYKAHACVLAFDVTRKVTYKNLDRWYHELREYCPGIPTICVANKIDVDYRVTERSFSVPDEAQAPILLCLGVGRYERREGVPAGDHDGFRSQGESERRFYDHGARITWGMMISR